MTTTDRLAAANRVKEFLRQRKIGRGNCPEVIYIVHSDVAAEEATLNVSDLEILISEAEQKQEANNTARQEALDAVLAEARLACKAEEDYCGAIGNGTQEHQAECSEDMHVQIVRLANAINTYDKAALTAQAEAQAGADLWICEKKAHLPEHDGATGYFYYVPVAPYVAEAQPADDEVFGAEKLARQFHETYERLAPSFGYETRKESAKPWSDVPDQNKRLMVAVCGEILSRPHTDMNQYSLCTTHALKPADDEARIEDIVQEITYHLNQARCLEKRTVGNHELASRIFENLAMRGYIRAATAPKNCDALVKALEEMIDAAKTGNIDSPTLQHPETGQDCHKWHEEWLYSAEKALAAYENHKGRVR